MTFFILEVYEDNASEGFEALDKFFALFFIGLGNGVGDFHAPSFMYGKNNV